MLKIGEFAKMCGASVQTLRYYDQIGVFCADHIDPDSGYRYYSRDKIKTFALIEQLKQLDFSLDEIKEFLACTPAQQCRIYRDKKDAIMKGIHNKYRQIGQIDVNCTTTQPGILPLNEQSLQMPFEDESWDDYLPKLFYSPLPPVTLRYGIPPSPVGTAYFGCPYQKYPLVSK